MCLAPLSRSGDTQIDTEPFKPSLVLRVFYITTYGFSIHTDLVPGAHHRLVENFVIVPASEEEGAKLPHIPRFPK